MSVANFDVHKTRLPSILIIINYFGIWPDWLSFFLESCRWNATVNWLLRSDQPLPCEAPPNVRFVRTTLEELCKHVKKELSIEFAPSSSYKICDIRPMYGLLFETELVGYDFFGYGDIDVIYGDLRRFYTADVLEYHDALSTHNWCLSGHLALLRNTSQICTYFTSIKNWRFMIENPDPVRFDEETFSQALLEGANAREGKLSSIAHDQSPRLYFREQFTTPLTPNIWIDGGVNHPEVWFWRSGKLTNDKDGEREFIYLHFMNFRNSRHQDPKYGVIPFWAASENVTKLKRVEHATSFRIDRFGIRACLNI